MNILLSRTGPRPLWLHLNAGAAMMAAAADGEGMAAASTTILQDAMAGVRAYHDSLVEPYCRDTQTVCMVKGSSLITGKEWHGLDVVILIPSLINGWHIFDIEERFSFAAYLQSYGLTPLIVDWEKPHHTDISLNEYITHHLKPLIDDAIQKGYRIKGVAGYCMGGTIIAALLSAYPELRDAIGKVVMIASPWDFSYQSIEQKTRLQTMAMQSYALSSPVPTDYVQSLFWAIDPLQIIKKFRYFPNVKNPDRFVRVEDWLNEGREVSLSVIQTCLFDWYRDNTIAACKWIVNDQVVSADALPSDIMIVAGENDNLVPEASLLPLREALPNAIYISCPTGHIGLMASDKSVESVWKPIADFLKKSSVKS